MEFSSETDSRKMGQSVFAAITSMILTSKMKIFCRSLESKIKKTQAKCNGIEYPPVIVAEPSLYRSGSS